MAKILVVDDTPDVVQLLVQSLTRQGHDVLAGHDGLQALELAAAHRPDAILLDIMMPRLNGIEACRRLKADPELQVIPVILLTARTLDEDAVEGLNAGAHDYVAKPFNIEVLAARLRSALRIKHSHDTIVRINAELRMETASRQKMERELIQAQRLEAVGQLAAGMAHEINTPVQYISHDLCFVHAGFARLQQMIGQLSGLGTAGGEPSTREGLIAGIEQVLVEANANYLAEEIPKALQESLEGVAQISNIVRAIGDFARSGGDEMMPTDLNRCLENALTISRHTWKQVADLVVDLDPHLPPLCCAPNLLGQVFLNLVANAAQAIAEVVGEGSGDKGTITIRTRGTPDTVEIHVQDNGAGIPDAVRNRVYDPFFTTRDVGAGRGLGLAISHAIVVEQHGGTIGFDTEMGRGTTFIVRLPITAGNGAEKGEYHDAYGTAGR